MTQSFESWVFIGLSATLAASGAVAVTQLGASPANAFIAGFADQDNTCPNGTPGCPGPNSPSSALPCSQCFFGGDEADA